MKDTILKILEIKKPRYITKVFLNKNYPSLYSEIIDKTCFLDDTCKISERLFCIVHDITSHPICPSCDKKTHKYHKFDMLVEDYTMAFCSCICSRKFSIDMSTPIDEANIISIELINRKVKDLHVETCKRDFQLINSIKYHLKINDDQYDDLSAVGAIKIFEFHEGKRPKCKVCGTYTKMNGSHTYMKHCSMKCRDINDETYEKRKATCLEKYGVENIMQYDLIKKRIKETFLLHYGVDHHTKHKDFVCKLGEGERLQSNICRIKNNGNKWIEYNKNYAIPLFVLEEFKGLTDSQKTYKWQCKNCDYVFKNKFHYIYIWDNTKHLNCPKCAINNKEYKIGQIFELIGIKVEYRVMNIIPYREIDIFLPDYNIGIEINGNYWHSDLNGKKSNYHIGKTKLAIKKDIRLYHLFEDEIENNYDIICSIFKNTLNKNNNTRVYARKCTIKTINNKEKELFLETNHLQGCGKKGLAYGLYYNGELVSVMSFSKARNGSKCDWELVRFCSKCDNNVIGGASKLLSHFKKNNKWDNIVTYADKRFSIGNLYNTIGFTHTHDTRPSYWYMLCSDYLKRYHKGNFTKSKIYKKCNFFDEKLTEWENMQLNGYDRIWDCGLMVFKLENNSN